MNPEEVYRDRDPIALHSGLIFRNWNFKLSIFGIKTLNLVKFGFILLAIRAIFLRHLWLDSFYLSKKIFDQPLKPTIISSAIMLLFRFQFRNKQSSTHIWQILVFHVRKISLRDSVYTICVQERDRYTSKSAALNRNWESNIKIRSQNKNIII